MGTDGTDVSVSFPTVLRLMQRQSSCQRVVLVGLVTVLRMCTNAC